MTDDPLDAMKARWSYIQGFLFPWMREDNDPITEALGRLVTTLDVIGLEAFVPEPPRGPGRPPEDRRALARAFVAKAVLGVPTTSALIERLDVDKSLRRILGWERRSQVPSEATFSRAFAEFARGALPDKIHAALIERALGGRIIGAIARDATEIEAREKPVQNTANDGKDDPPAPDNPAPPRKRGRPRKGEQRPRPEPTRLKRQVTQNLSQMLADLPTACDVGCKKNSKGYKETWTGYKLHIDVACGQIPVSCVLTSASVHDSQVAIPLMTMTSARVAYLYDLMDAAYDAAAIHDQSRTLGHAPIVDRNFRADHQAKAEWGREVERLKLIHRPDFDDLIYDLISRTGFSWSSCWIRSCRPMIGSSGLPSTESCGAPGSSSRASAAASSSFSLHVLYPFPRLRVGLVGFPRWRVGLVGFPRWRVGLVGFLHWRVRLVGFPHWRVGLASSEGPPTYQGVGQHLVIGKLQDRTRRQTPCQTRQL